MDKFERRRTDYRTDWEDGTYLVTHITNETSETEEKFQRTITIKNGSVYVPGDLDGFNQSSFFEVNKVLQKLN